MYPDGDVKNITNIACCTMSRAHCLIENNKSKNKFWRMGGVFCFNRQEKLKNWITVH